MSDISVKDFITDAADLANRAVAQDRIGNGDVAVYFYRESVSLLSRARNELYRRVSGIEGTEQGILMEGKINEIDKKVQEYHKRIDELEKIAEEKQEKESKAPVKTPNELEFERAKFWVFQALQEDELGNDEKAFELYTEAVKLCLQIKKGEKLDAQLASKIEQLARQALDRCEVIKGVNKNSQNVPPPKPTFSRNQAATPDLEDLDLEPDPNELKGQNAGGSGYTKEEKKVLLSTSRVNGIDYLPYMQVDRYEKFAFPLPFTDPKGMLKLSPKQQADFHKWIRPSEVWSNPSLILNKVECFSIKQTIVSDCSVVASLAVSALYEKRFGKRLITANIFPQNKAGIPVYNPCGKYLVKINVNGVWRKVIIDDYLPIGKRGQLLCSYSNNKGELWVSLMEKAYMKVMGGYDFPGSNSNIDLHALTGWIPERIPIRSKEGERVFDAESTFKKMHSRLHVGDVLITVATEYMSPQEEERTGLVSTHAYAVLDIQERLGRRLFLLKNPWSHVRWKGKYSELDKVNWTTEMKQAFKYDPNSAEMFDNGVFWIEYQSLIQFFDVFYLSWNPALFPHTTSLHKTWDAGIGPVKDMYNIGENPQYRLEVRASTSATVWCHLTRHITDIEDFKNNREFLAILVYDTNGKKVYYPCDPPPIIDGARINSPHYLCKIIIPNAGTKRYTLVVSQYEKMKTIHYTLRAYSSCPFTLHEIHNICKYKEEVTGEWNDRTAGGCANHQSTYKNNPCYKLTMKSPLNGHIMIVELRGPKEYDVGFDIICSNVTDVNAQGFFTKMSSGSFRRGFAILELEKVPSGVYNIIPSTFLPGCKGPFILKIQCTSDFTLKPI